jgi:hypothetical protein
VTRQQIGKGITIAAVSLIFLAYSNFVPTSLSSDMIADYVKNHFVREVTFGLALAVITIWSCWITENRRQYVRTGILGSIVVMPFWVATFFGWSTGGLAEVWGGEISNETAYALHGTQVIAFYLGLLIMLPQEH